MRELEERIEALENDRAGLEWMVIFLAKKVLSREENAVAAALAMQREIKQFGRAFVDYALSSEEGSDNPGRVMGFSSSINFLAEQIIEDVKATAPRNQGLLGAA